MDCSDSDSVEVDPQEVSASEDLQSFIPAACAAYFRIYFFGNIFAILIYFFRQYIFSDNIFFVVIYFFR